jgi:hypothetical protein
MRRLEVTELSQIRGEGRWGMEKVVAGGEVSQAIGVWVLRHFQVATLLQSLELEAYFDFGVL